MTATVVEANGNEYTIECLGIWQAESKQKLSINQHVKIESFNGLIANVIPIGDSND